ncbi:hypothetical protein [Cylindrospermopsis raciborskii]|uniref:Uncharacterized protein n=1 Tax=Cylindrospermopsis raciborskii CENA302 TaxID=1170768 RepID=A0A9Q5WAL7_9CYAN|nr:hypothetical protein [Cylindrospermopsis raciborskii]NLQ04383.1 hypothetical protein [Cylindrospermopsis raciborskii MVCC19]OPH10526.1 hypothetical protein CENA302_04680 [Cylindrospermopsis raciborskii CENA302]
MAIARRGMRLKEKMHDSITAYLKDGKHVWSQSPLLQKHPHRQRKEDWLRIEDHDINYYKLAI